MSLFFTISFVIAGLLLIIALSYVLYWYNQKYSCESYANYWCFNDWTCYGESDDPSNFRYKYPAKYLYCGQTTDPKFCQDPLNKAHPACSCNIGKEPNGCLPQACACVWNDPNSPLNLGDCGSAYCSNGDTTKCTP